MAQASNEFAPGAESAVPQPRRAAVPAFFRPRHWLILLSFVVAVVLPTVIAAIYLYGTAADQYGSKVGFAVRNEETSNPFELFGNVANLSGSSSSDTDILYEFIQSQELVEAVDEVLDLHAMYSKPARDWVFRLDPDASIEDLMDYWSRMVKVTYDPGTGLIELESRAFEPEDARDVAQAIFDRSSAMINALSAVAREDLTQYARDELDQAVERLKVARQELTVFRNANQLVDPSADIQGQMGLLNSLQAQLADTLIELDLLSQTTRDNDPRLETARRRAEVIQKRIESERTNLGVTDGSGVGAFAELVSQFESLRVDMEFAEKAYIASLTAYDNAVAEARRQNRYLAAYLNPTLAETPQYPQRAIILILLALMLLGSWAILVLVYYSLRDRR